MLAGTRLELHDIRDAAAVVSSVVRTSKLELRFHEREDLEQYLLGELWILSLRYEPGGISFSTWATTTLKLRTIDFFRRERGRTRWQFGDGRVHERERPTFVSLEVEHGDRLDAALAAGGGDPADVCDPALQRVLADGDRTRSRDLETLGLDHARRAG